MDQSSFPLKAKLLWRAEEPDAIELYRAALEWSLVEPIVIESRDDLKSEVLWRSLIKPYNHQVTNLITFCRRLPVTLLADDVGLGKTISAGLIVSELMSRDRLSKVLIVCPKLLIPQWSEELEKKFGIASTMAIGRDLIKAKPPKDIGAVITTYASARLYLDDIEDAGYQMLILDEAHKLRNLFGVDAAPQVALRFKKAFKDRLFRYVLMLTATPIQNRLWDLYSLVDLLTTARGHENPFGSTGIFARKFIEDKPQQARRLNPETKDEFRSIVYGYMSRVRRGDANLYFPKREVFQKAVLPSSGELELLELITEPIQDLNRLGQISVLQAFISSPEALSAQLKTMARNETIPAELAASVREVVKKITITSKMQGLAALIEKLRKERPNDWRAVIFTTRRETQTSIQAFLESQKIPCGIINGESGRRNQETIENFKCNPPVINVIVSTEAGSEGVNLQAANVLVNYDLPWNPMVVEQRIGRVQRLASEHASVSIFNITLKGTFEEYIVGRLMEKLQMASHAIGDIESLLQASGMGDGEGEISSFEDEILKLVMASLAGKDVEKATSMAEKSILDAQTQLEQEEKNIDNMLGSMDGAAVDEPMPPKLSPIEHSMSAREFVLSALKKSGAKIAVRPSGMYTAEVDGRKEIIRFDNEVVEPEVNSTLYTPGTSAFERLVHSFTNRGYHNVIDADSNPLEKANSLASAWAQSFAACNISTQPQEIYRNFEGVATLRVRATVAHDSYERLVDAVCVPNHGQDLGRLGLEPLHQSISDPVKIGLDIECLVDKAANDPDIADFCRFYKERLERERIAAGSDERKVKKIEDDFTPRLSGEIVGLSGKVARSIKLLVEYKLDSEATYKSSIEVVPAEEKIVSQPEIKKCERTHRLAPSECFSTCEISKLQVLTHLLVTSEISGRLALPEHVLTCAYSNKKILEDESTKSDLTGKIIAASLSQTSAISGRKGEPTFFDQCEFTSVVVLKDELLTSEISGKKYRFDEQLSSSVSGRKGYHQEFIKCFVTGNPLLQSEAEKCEVTGQLVMPGILERCEVTKKMVLPCELAKSAFSGKKALKRFMVTSSVAGASLLESEAIISSDGKYCIPLETQTCLWSGGSHHPDDMRVCHLTGGTYFKSYVTTDTPPRLAALVGLLDGTSRKADAADLWPEIVRGLSPSIGGTLRIEATELSPNGNHLAVCIEVTKWLIMTRQVGMLYSVQDKKPIGRVVSGKRNYFRWSNESGF